MPHSMASQNLNVKKRAYEQFPLDGFFVYDLTPSAPMIGYFRILN